MTHRDSQTETEKISSEIAHLFELKTNELKDRWRAVYGNEPPPRSSKKLLISAIAYKIQERALGGLKPSRSACSSMPPKIQAAAGLHTAGKLREPRPERS